MRAEGEAVFVRWYGKVLQGNVVKENDMFGMTAVRIPLQGQQPIALFTPGHIYDTAEAAGITQSVPNLTESVPELTESVPKYAESVPKAAETSMCEAFKKAHWDNEHNHLRTDSLDEFYSLWKREHAHVGYTETPTPKPAPVSGTKPCTKAVAKKQTETIQLSLFD
jgi:hypothetical protein